MNWMFPLFIAGIGVYRLIGLKNAKEAEKRGEVDIEKGPFMISLTGSILMVLIGLGAAGYVALGGKF